MHNRKRFLLIALLLAGLLLVQFVVALPGVSAQTDATVTPKLLDSPSGTSVAGAQVQINGFGTFDHDEVFNIASGSSFQYRLVVNNKSGPWTSVTFDPGAQDWVLVFATITPSLVEAAGGGAAVPGATVQINGAGTWSNGDTIHLPPGLTVQYRLQVNNKSGAWVDKDFIAGTQPWELVFATIAPSLVDGLGGAVPGATVTVNGAGTWGHAEVFHLPPGLTVQYRLQVNNKSGAWVDKDFIAGTQPWELVFATIAPSLVDGLGGPVPGATVTVNGAGTWNHSEVFHLPPGLTIQYRLNVNNKSGAWADMSFVAGPQPWELVFATITPSLVDMVGGLEVPGATVTVNGAGTWGHTEVFHLPPGLTIQYRLNVNNKSGAWADMSFVAGPQTWELVFATVTPLLLSEGAAVPGATVTVNGAGTWGHAEVFHLPPGLTIQYRLNVNNKSGPWADMSFIAGKQDWALEFVAVTFTFDDALPSDLADLMSTTINGAGTVPNNGVIYLPPGVALQFRAQGSGWSGAWFTQIFEAGAGIVTWTLGPVYIAP